MDATHFRATPYHIGGMLPGHQSAAVSLLALLPAFILSGQEAEVGGRISGHVYRSESGEAVPNAVVTLMWPDFEKAVTVRAGQDGGYSFEGLDLQEQYLVAAWLGGLSPTFYPPYPGGPSTPISVMNSVIDFKRGSRLENIDLHLTRMAQITQMNDDRLAAAYPNQRGNLDFRTGRFSADGQQFAFTTMGVYAGDPEQAWSYDLKLGRLDPITGTAVKSEPTRIFDIEWAADTLYLTSARTDRPYFPDQKTRLGVTRGVTTPLSRLPAEVVTLFEQRERGELAAGSFFFTLERACHGCEWDVRVQLDGRKRRVLKVVSPDIVADSTRPILFYEMLGYLNAIGSFNLQTEQFRELPLPMGRGIDATELLAATRVQRGFLIAYATRDRCVPELNPDGSPSWLHPSPRPKRICFARFPDPR